MTVSCGWCKKLLGHKPGVGVTHGICRHCELKELVKAGIASPDELDELLSIERKET